MTNDRLPETEVDPTSDRAHAASRETKNVVATNDVMRVSDRDYRRVTAMLEHPSRPNARLKAAIAALADIR